MASSVDVAVASQLCRDLAQNWNIDVAKDLEDYLDELETITITFDGGKTSLNFAEAAYLIQGSAVVYSRKVEYLYALIYQTLDMLQAKASAKNRDKKWSAAAEKAAREDKDAEELAAEAEEEFLMLEDIIPAGHHIDLGETMADIAMSAAMTVAFAHGMGGQGHGNASMLLNMTHGSAPGAGLASTPAARHAASTLLSRTPLARLGSLGGAGSSLALAGGMQGPELMDRLGTGAPGGMFRLSSTPVASNGALILGGSSSVHALSLSLTSTHRARPLGTASLMDAGAGTQDETAFARAAAPALALALAGKASGPSTWDGATESTETASEAGTGHPRAGHAEDDDAGTGDDGWFYDPVGTDSNHNADTDDYGGADIDYGAGAGDSASVASSAAVAGPVTRSKGVALPVGMKKLRALPGASSATVTGHVGGGHDKGDAWAQLDPSADAGASTRRPFKAGRTYLVLKDPAAIASKGPLRVSAEAMAAAAVGKAKTAPREAKQLLAYARAVAARAAAARMTSSSSYPTAHSPPSAALPSSSRTAPRLLCLNPVPCSLLGGGRTSGSGPNPNLRSTDPVTRRVADVRAALEPLIPALSATLPCTVPDLEVLARTQRAATARLRTAARRVLVGMSSDAAAAGGAYTDAEGDAWADTEGVEEEEERHGNGDGDMLPGAGEDGGPDFGGADYDYGDGQGEVVEGGEGLRNPVDGTTGAVAVAAHERAGPGFSAPSFQGDVLQYLDTGAAADAAHAATRARRVANKMDHRISEALGAAPRAGTVVGEDEAYWREVRDRIAKYADGADKWLSASAVSRKVDKWAALLQPVLACEDKRPEFDIHGLGNTLLGCLQGCVGQEGLGAAAPEAVKDGSARARHPVNFMSLVAAGAARQATAGEHSEMEAEGAPGPADATLPVQSIQPYQVARLFLATLQLAVAGNVEVIGQTGAPGGSPQPAAQGVGGKGTKGGQGAGAADAGASGDDDSWMFSQAVAYDDDDAVVEKGISAARVTASSRAAALAESFKAPMHVGAEAFSVRLLHTRLVRPDFDGSQGIEIQSASMSGSSDPPAGVAAKAQVAGAKGKRARAVADGPPSPSGLGDPRPSPPSPSQEPTGKRRARGGK